MGIKALGPENGHAASLNGPIEKANRIQMGNKFNHARLFKCHAQLHEIHPTFRNSPCRMRCIFAAIRRGQRRFGFFVLFPQIFFLHTDVDKIPGKDFVLLPETIGVKSPSMATSSMDLTHTL